MQITPTNYNTNSFKANVRTKGLSSLPFNHQKELLNAIPRIKDLGDETTEILLQGKKVYFLIRLI